MTLREANDMGYRHAIDGERYSPPDRRTSSETPMWSILRTARLVAAYQAGYDEGRAELYLSGK